MKVGLPSANEKRQRGTRQTRFINDELRGWFLCRVSDRNAARMPRLLVLAIRGASSLSRATAWSGRRRRRDHKGWLALEYL